MNTTIYLIRHSKRMRVWYKTRKDFEEYMQPLTIEGEKEAQKICSLKELDDIDVIYSSPTGRTMATIKYLSERLNKEVILDERLIERKLGNWGIKDDQGKKDWLEYGLKQWNDFDYKLFDGESLNEVKKRIIDAINEIINNNKSKTIAICTHGMAMNILFNHYDSKVGVDYIKNIESPSIFKLVYDNNNNLISYDKILYNK